MDPKRLDHLAHLEYLGLTEAEAAKVVSPFEKRGEDEKEDPAKFVLRLMRNPDYFYYTCKVLLNVELMPFQCAILKEMWTCRFPMLIGSRGLGKSFLLGTYAVLRALLKQGSKVVICGSGFRQAKTVFNYAANIWHNSPTLQGIVSENSQSGIRLGTDRWVLQLGDSTVVSLPIGDGSRIRGERANCILSDEFASLPEQVFEEVISGFGVVNLSPVAQVKKAARRRAMLVNNLVTADEAAAMRSGDEGNQILISGTAYYAFNHFFKYWKNWRIFVESRGDREWLLKQHGKEVGEKFNHADYKIIRFPYTLLPENYYDEAQIERSKTTLHSGNFQNEFGACTHPDEYVVTSEGVRKMADVEVGDLVLTHRGRFRHVTEKTCRPYGGQVVKYKTVGCTFESVVTPDHPYWNGGDEWQSLGDLQDGTKLSNLVELSGLTEVDLRPIVRNYLEDADGGIYFPPGSTKLGRETIREIRESGEKTQALADRLGMTYQKVWAVRKRREGKRKFAIPPVLSLNYDMGLILGYYASEGSVGSGDRAVGFALDGHVDTSLEAYVEELAGALRRVLGLDPKFYRKQEVVSVTVTNSLFVDFIKWVCPGLAHQKKVRGEILYSNKEFLRGFLRGYWSGDGHLPPTLGSATPIAASVSLDLIVQLRTAFSHFGILGAVRKVKKQTTKFRGREYNTRQAYTISFNGSNERTFRREIFSQDVPDAPGKTRSTQGDGWVRLPFVQKDLVPYQGMVYNLEVDEDHSYSLLNATVHNCFSADSNGFFKRSLIETCVASKNNPVTPGVSGAAPVWFDAVTRGNPACRYVLGIDPASEKDNFAIIVLEVHPDHRRIVYCWTTDRERFKAKVNQHLIEEKDYYGYCARKVRNLLQDFPGVEAIALDAQGGGQNGVLEALHDPDKMKPGEKAIWIVQPGHVLSDGKERPEDDQPGLHIVELVQFADAKYVSGANHGLRKDFEDRVLLFPQRDAVTLSEAFVKDQAEKRIFDTLEDCVDEIDALKDELATIEHTQTPGTLRDKWDTPEVKMAGSKKGRMRKDRYSALLMANYAARRLDRQFELPAYEAHGGFADQIKAAGNEMYAFAPDWFNEQTEGNYDHYGWAS